jgi:hypothetical protein
VAAASEAPICQQAVTSRNPADVVAAFRAARLHGRDAEGCLSAAALARYRDARCTDADLAASPGPLVLYHCGSHRVVAMPDVAIQVERSDSGSIQIEVDLSGPQGQSIRVDEHLRIARGTPAGTGEAAEQVIVSVDDA